MKHIFIAFFLLLSLNSLSFANDKDNGGDGFSLLKFYKGYPEVTTKVTDKYRKDFCQKLQDASSYLNVLLSIKNSHPRLNEKFNMNFNSIHLYALSSLSYRICESPRALEYERDMQVWKEFNTKSKIKLGENLEINGKPVVAINSTDGSIQIDSLRWDSLNNVLQSAIALHEVLSHPLIKIEETNNYTVSSCILANHNILKKILDRKERMRDWLHANPLSVMPTVFLAPSSSAGRSFVSTSWFASIASQEQLNEIQRQFKVLGSSPTRKSAEVAFEKLLSFLEGHDLDTKYVKKSYGIMEKWSSEKLVNWVGRTLFDILSVRAAHFDNLGKLKSLTKNALRRGFSKSEGMKIFNQIHPHWYVSARSELNLNESLINVHEEIKLNPCNQAKSN